MDIIRWMGLFMELLACRFVNALEDDHTGRKIKLPYAVFQQ